MVVYFNNWFSSISDVIADIKNRHNNITIIGSSHNKNHVMTEIVDEFYVEDCSDETYSDWILNFIKKHNVNVFFPKGHIEEIYTIWKDIEKMGVIIAANSKKSYNLVESKYKTYEIVKANTNIKIPACVKTTDKTEITRFIDTHNCIVKLDNGEGGESYKRITDKELTINDLVYGRHNQVTKEEIMKLLCSPAPFEKFLFMDYLESPEISVDCYNSKKGFIAICRSKIGGTRAQKIYCNSEISEACKTLGTLFELNKPFNVQFRKVVDGDENNFDDFRLLEINPRLSGGTYYQTLVGLNICDVCLCDILSDLGDTIANYDIDDYTKFDERIISHVERGIVIK